MTHNKESTSWRNWEFLRGKVICGQWCSSIETLMAPKSMMVAGEPADQTVPSTLPRRRLGWPPKLDLVPQPYLSPAWLTIMLAHENPVYSLRREKGRSKRNLHHWECWRLHSELYPAFQFLWQKVCPDAPWSAETTKQKNPLASVLLYEIPTLNEQAHAEAKPMIHSQAPMAVIQFLPSKFKT